jgi:prophage regulatory protein
MNAYAHINEPAPLRRLLAIDEVSHALGGNSRSWIYAAIRDKGFPAPTRLSRKCSRWDSLAVQAWIANQLAESAK